MQKVIFKDNVNGAMCFYDATCWEDYYEEYGYRLGRFDPVAVGVFIDAAHYCLKSALYDDLTNYQDTLQDEENEKLKNGVTYTVCYYKNDDSDLLQFVDHKISRQDIVDNILSNRYVEGAEIFETEKLVSGKMYSKKFQTLEYSGLVFHPYRDLTIAEKGAFGSNIEKEELCSFSPSDWKQKDFVEASKKSCSHVDLYTVNGKIILPTAKGWYLYHE